MIGFKECNSCIFPILSIYEVGRAHKCYLTDKYDEGVVMCAFIGGIRNFDITHYYDYSYNYHFYTNNFNKRRRTNDILFYEYMIRFVKPKHELKQYSLIFKKN